MDQAVKELWVNALRSGEYKQAHGTLSDGVGFCCLGVLCELAIKAGVQIVKTAATEFGDEFSYDGESGLPPESVQSWAQLPDPNPLVSGNGKFVGLAVLNDGGDEVGGTPYTFAQIADIINDQL